MYRTFSNAVSGDAATESLRFVAFDDCPTIDVVIAITTFTGGLRTAKLLNITFKAQTNSYKSDL
jgi:hypothetical protein